MIERVIAFSLTNRLLVVLMTVGVLGGGAFALTRLPIDAFPDVSPVLVQIVTEAPGLAPEEVEKLITYPVEVAMNGLPKVEQVKSISAFGISQVSVYFKDDVDVYFARQLTLEKLQQAKSEIPPGLGEPKLGPITTGLGQIYQYVVRGGQSTTELRTLQDWVVKYNLRTVPGVTEVLSFGGEVKQYQLRVDPRTMLQYGVSLQDIRLAVGANNRNVGGGYITRGPEEYIIRGIGLAENIGDLGNIIVGRRGVTPVYVRNIAEVVIGPEVRRGAVTMNGKGEAVSGIVLKRIYENTSQVIAAVKLRVAEVNKALPSGVQIIPFYDQSELVDRAVGTVEEALLEGAVLIVVILFLFLGNVRSALIVTTMLPLSLLLAFMLMQYFGFSANLMSLGGLAIGIGMMVDGGVVMVENVYRHLSEEHAEPRLHVILRAASEVGRPIVFAIAIIILVFLPLLTLQGVEGKMFRPMALTVAFAILGAFILSLTYVPMISALLLSKKVSTKESFSDKFIARLQRVYEPVLQWSLHHRWLILVGAVALFVVAGFLFSRMGGEFIPQLDEGDFAVDTRTLTGSSLSETVDATLKAERIILRKFPEVEQVVAKIGSGEIPTDPMSIEAADLMIILKPRADWTSA